MAARRLILVMLVLLVLSSAVAALIPVDRGEPGDTTSTTSTATTTAPPSGKLVTARISADRKDAKRVIANRGDQLRLTVSSSKPGDVEIVALGVFENVDRFLPAVIDLLLFDQGRYPVRLIPPAATTGEGRKIGVVVVRGEGGGG
jgi:hypothetical protein